MNDEEYATIITELLAGSATIINGKEVIFYVRSPITKTAEILDIENKHIIIRFYLGEVSYGRVIQQDEYKNGKAHGLQLSFNDDGKKMIEVNYENGKIHGEELFYHKGILIGKYNYEHGKPKGPYTEWYIEGDIKCKGVFY